MNPWLISGVLAFILISGTVGYRLGVDSERGKQAQANFVQLDKDAKELPKIEAKDNERKVQIIKRVERVKKESPDWFNTPLPDSVVDSLRFSCGAKTGCETNPGLLSTTVTRKD